MPDSDSVRIAPLALFVYNRPGHAQQTISALQRNDLASETELYIFADGSKSGSDQHKVESVRKYIETVAGFKKTTIIARDVNLGLARSIINGVTEIIERHGRIIVLEDDMVTSPYFLRYMNDALDFYKDEERVISIHGYAYPVKSRLPETYLLKGADCWGWATWQRGWDLFDPDGKKLLDELVAKDLTRQFDFDGAYGYTHDLEKQVNGTIDSWAIRWYASAFLKEKLTLYPGRSLIRNIGTDESGTHCCATDKFDNEVSLEPLEVGRIPVEESQIAREAFRRFFLSLKPSPPQRVWNKISRMVAGKP